MSKPSFTFCSKMAVEHERVGNLLRCKSEPWIFYNIFIFFFFQDEDHFYVDLAPKRSPFRWRIAIQMKTIFTSIWHPNEGHFASELAPK